MKVFPTPFASSCELESKQAMSSSDRDIVDMQKVAS
jgi:hypothetical protein